MAKMEHSTIEIHSYDSLLNTSMMFTRSAWRVLYGSLYSGRVVMTEEEKLRLENLGFRYIRNGAHSARTIMIDVISNISGDSLLNTSAPNTLTIFPDNPL